MIMIMVLIMCCDYAYDHGYQHVYDYVQASISPQCQGSCEVGLGTAGNVGLGTACKVGLGTACKVLRSATNSFGRATSSQSQIQSYVTVTCRLRGKDRFWVRIRLRVRGKDRFWVARCRSQANGKWQMDSVGIRVMITLGAFLVTAIASIHVLVLMQGSRVVSCCYGYDLLAFVFAPLLMSLN